MVDVMTRPGSLDLDITAILSTIPDDEIPRVEPRRYDEKAYPRWDATDEIYITYNEEGERALITTGQEDIWNTEHSYQKTGSPRYSVLRGLAGRAVGIATVVGDRARGAAGRLRPGVFIDPGDSVGVFVDAGATGADGDEPSVHPDRHGYHPRRRLGGRTRDRAEDNGTGAHGAARHSRNRAERSGVPERSNPGSPYEHEPRSHRHCPGCSGHSGTNRSGRVLAFRALVGWVIGYLALGYGGLQVTPERYAVLTGLGLLAAYAFRPVWREWTHAEDRRVKGGRGPR